MPVDADAYMAGAIPTLSRGGSWLPRDPNATGSIAPMVTHRGSSFDLSPHFAHSPQTLPPSGPAVYAGRASGPARSPFFAQTVAGGGGGGGGGGAGAGVVSAPSEMAGAATIHGLKHKQVLGPVQHPGWLKTGSEADGGSVAGSSESAIFARGSRTGGGGGWGARLAPPAMSMVSVASIPHSMRSNRSRRYSEREYQGYHFDEHLPGEMGRSWERHEGSPKPTTPEMDYGLKRESGGDRKHHGGEGGGEGRGGRGGRISDASAPSPYRKLPEHLVLPPVSSDPPGLGKPPPSSDYRPELERQRSHTTPVLSPKPKKIRGEDDLGRSAQLNRQLARLSLLKGRRCRAPDPPPHSAPPIGHLSVHPRPRGGPLSPGTPSSVAGKGAGRRPSLGRRHSSVASPSSSHAPSSLPSSPVHNKHLTQLQHSRTRHSSTPHTPRSAYFPHGNAVSTCPGYNDLAASGATVDFTGAPSSPAAGGRRSRAGSQAGTPVVKQFPRLGGSVGGGGDPAGGPHHSPSGVASPRGVSGVFSGKDASPIGYISPLADDPYDRYAVHPSAPTPDRIERALHGVGAPSSALPSQDDTHTEPESVLRPPQERPPSNGVYLPLGYARPVQDMPWNREGPAMKTYGIAWLREGEPERLPEGPEGPRWQVARPPREEHMLGGGWWQSGGDGTAEAGGSRA